MQVDIACIPSAILCGGAASVLQVEPLAREPVLGLITPDAVIRSALSDQDVSGQLSLLRDAFTRTRVPRVVATADICCDKHDQSMQ